jgi:hypothetical protein
MYAPGCELPAGCQKEVVKLGCHLMVESHGEDLTEEVPNELALTAQDAQTAGTFNFVNTEKFSRT